MNDPSGARSLFARWREQLVAALGSAREELDALNVFPVPDKDTGTNVYLTVEAAATAADAADAAGAGLDDVARAFVDGALRGARGNSGVIVSQLLRASVPALVASAAGGADTAVDADTAGDAGTGLDPGRLAGVLTAAADAAYAAVEEPVEGTILTVARAAAEAATEAAAAAATAAAATPAGRRAAMAAVLRAATDAAQVALARTPDQLDRLRQAGVVDAGGQALTVLLDTTERVVTGRVDARGRSRRRPVPVPAPSPPAGGQGGGGPAYEVMYLLDAPDRAVPELRAELAPLGDSLVVVGGDGLWNVHVHVDDPGAAIEAAIRVGRPHRVQVTHLATAAGRGGPPEEPHRGGGGRAVVTTAAGRGLADLFRAAGAVVVDAMDGHRPGTEELLEAATSLPASPHEVVLVPNDRHVRTAAEVAARRLRERPARVAVIPTITQLQGLAAIAVHDPGRDFDDDVVQMTAAAGHTRHGAVTVARGEVMTSAGRGPTGSVLGVVDGDVALVGDDLISVAEGVLDRLFSGSGELLTVVVGAGADAGLGVRLEQLVARSRPGTEVSVHTGGPAGYPLLLAVE